MELTTAEGVATTGGGTSSEGDGSSGPAVVTTTMMGMTTTGAVGTSEGGESGEAGCGGPCDAPPGGCFSAVGACVAGECVYAPIDADVGCDDGDACTEGDVCDGAGGCQGAAISCERPHASGGVCEGGVCQGFVCVAPWADCDSDWDNGCEVPVGVANQCDAAGLNPEGGCWTAYCGQLDDAKARNFGTFYCYDCSTCNTPAPGLWQWCNHTTGNWYPSEAGTCGKNEDLVCAPPP